MTEMTSIRAGVTNQNYHPRPRSRSAPHPSAPQASTEQENETELAPVASEVREYATTEPGSESNDVGEKHRSSQLATLILKADESLSVRLLEKSNPQLV